MWIKKSEIKQEVIRERLHEEESRPRVVPVTHKVPNVQDAERKQKQTEEKQEDHPRTHTNNK